jgi:hypothetical protein
MSKQITIKSSYDFETKYFIPLVVVALMITVYLIDKNQDYSSLIGMVILFILAGLFSIFLIPYRIILIDGEFIELKRIQNSIKIQLNELIDFDLVNFDDLKRLYGIGGFLGYYGDYESCNHGKIKLMAKSSRNIIVVCTKESKIAFSVDNPDHCEQIIRSFINQNY